MADTSNLTNFLQDVADAIKEKKEYESTQKIAAEDFDTEIASIDTAKVQTKSVTYQSNGNFTVEPDTGFDGISSLGLTINVPQGQDVSDANLLPKDAINPGVFYNANGRQVGSMVATKEVINELKTIGLTSDVQITSGPVFLFADGVHMMVPCMVNGTRSFVIGVYDIVNKTFTSIPSMIKSYDELNIASGVDMGQSDLSRQESSTGNYYLIAKHKTNANSYSLVAINFLTNTFEFKLQTTAESSTTYSVIFNPAKPNIFYYNMRSSSRPYDKIRVFSYAFGTNELTNIQNATYGNNEYADNSGWLHISQDGRFITKPKSNDYNDNLSYVVSSVDGKLTKSFTVKDGKFGITPDTRYAVSNSGIHSINITSDTTATATKLNSVNLPSRNWKIDYFFLGNTNKLLSSSGSTFDLYDVNYETGTYTKLDTVNYNSYSKTAPFPYMVLNTGSTASIYGYIPSDKILQITRENQTLYATEDANISASDVLNSKIGYGSSGKVTGTMANNGALNYTPSTSQQTIPAGYTSGGTISAVDSTIDANITQNNIRAGVTILGVEGNLEPDKPDQTKTVTPTTSQQVIEPDTGYELASVTVNAVDSSIDENIIASNIKKDVKILGVVGTLESGGTSDTTGIETAHYILTLANGNTNSYDGIGDTYENDYRILNYVISGGEYTSAGGTDTQILANLNSILGIAS